MASKKIILKIFEELANSNEFILKEKFGEWKLFESEKFKTKISLSGFFHLKERIYYTSGSYSLDFDEINNFIKEYSGKDIYRLFDSETKKLCFFSEEILYFLQIHFGEKNYPNGIYNTFTIQQVEETPELVKSYLDLEYFKKGLSHIEANYSTIEKSDITINNEILKNCYVKKHNLNWADYDNQCIKSILLAHFNNNPNIEKLVNICNQTMIEEKLKNPNNPRIPLYNFILQKLKFEEI